MFSHPEKLERINEITHRYIIAEVLKRIENSPGKMAGIDGAVLFESGVTEKCGAVIGVLAIAAFVLIAFSGENTVKWIITLILASAYVVLGVIGIVDYYKSNK